MRKAHLQKQEWLRQGHGVYHELASQQEFFDCSKRSKQMVVHFYRPTTARCEIVDAHLEKLAPRHPETRVRSLATFDGCFVDDGIDANAFLVVLGSALSD